MTTTASKNEIMLARVAVVARSSRSQSLALSGTASADVRHRVWQQLIERPTGPMAFRFILQPAMAAFAAMRDGIKDAKSQRSPYLWTLFTSPLERGGRLNEGLISTARIILLGLCMDVIYQFIVLKTFYPGEAVIVAIALAVVPYMLLRGPFARIARWWLGAASADENR